MKARELMTETIQCCTPSTPVFDAARVMRDKDIGAIPVVESEERRNLIGVVTDRDFVIRLIAEDMNPLECTVEQAMTGRVFSVHPEDSEEQLCHLMEEHQVRRVPVIDDEGNCIGIVSQADIARRASEHETAEVLKDISRPGHGQAA